jgi:hypothetical protein
MHANARLTPIGRLTMVMRIETGRPVAHVAAEMGISRPTAYKWWHRWDELGAEGLVLFGSMLICQQARIVVPWTMRGTGTSSPGMHARSSKTKPIISTL